MPTVETIGKRVEEAAGDASSEFSHLKKQWQKSGDQLKAKTEDAIEEVSDLVRRHPGMAVGITLAAGFILGSLTAANRRRGSATDHIKDLAGTGADAWGRLRNGFEEAAYALKDGVDDAMKKFK